MFSRLAEAVPGAWPEAELRTANSAGGSQRLSDPQWHLKSGVVAVSHAPTPGPRPLGCLPRGQALLLPAFLGQCTPHLALLKYWGSVSSTPDAGGL